MSIGGFFADIPTIPVATTAITAVSIIGIVFYEDPASGPSSQHDTTAITLPVSILVPLSPNENPRRGRCHKQRRPQRTSSANETAEAARYD